MTNVFNLQHFEIIQPAISLKIISKLTTDTHCSENTIIQKSSKLMHTFQLHKCFRFGWVWVVFLSSHVQLFLYIHLFSIARIDLFFLQWQHQSTQIIITGSILPPHEQREIKKKHVVG